MTLSPTDLKEFENSPTPMWIFDIRTLAFLAINDAAVSKYGYTREQFLAMTILDIRPAEDIVPLLRDELRDGKHYADHEIWRHRRRDGSVFPVKITSREIAFNQLRAEIVTAEECGPDEPPEPIVDSSITPHDARLSICESPHPGLFVIRRGS